VQPARATAAAAHPEQVLGDARNAGHGRRLTAAFEALENFPALVESRDRVLRVVKEAPAPVSAVVSAVESDVALVIAVLRLANRSQTRERGKLAGIPAAVEALGADGVAALAQRAPIFDFFERTPGWDLAPERFRLHAIATQSAADRIARETGFADRDELLISALLHDIGKLVLVHAYPGYPTQVHGEARTPEERLHRERRELGVDHALVGGVLARRWRLPDRLAATIERHHADDAPEEAQMVRLADMLGHYGHGEAVDPGSLLQTAQAVGLSPEALRAVMYELPNSNGGERRGIEPCPLSVREVEVMRLLAEGKVYKQIAQELDLSTSTVRTHLHNTYAKLGAVDRAQAVLMATARGWL